MRRRETKELLGFAAGVSTGCDWRQRRGCQSSHHTSGPSSLVAVQNICLPAAKIKKQLRLSDEVGGAISFRTKKHKFWGAFHLGNTSSVNPGMALKQWGQRWGPASRSLQAPLRQLEA